MVEKFLRELCVHFLCGLRGFGCFKKVNSLQLILFFKTAETTEKIQREQPTEDTEGFIVRLNYLY